MFVCSVDFLKIFTVIYEQKSPYQTVEGSPTQATATTIIQIGIKDPLSLSLKNTHIIMLVQHLQGLKLAR